MPHPLAAVFPKVLLKLTPFHEADDNHLCGPIVNWHGIGGTGSLACVGVRPGAIRQAGYDAPMPEEPTIYKVCDGDLVLELRPAGKGWYAVTSPMEPELHTQAKSIEEAFDMARDAMSMIWQMRREDADQPRAAAAAA